jgi:hypothetical protein
LQVRQQQQQQQPANLQGVTQQRQHVQHEQVKKCKAATMSVAIGNPYCHVQRHCPLLSFLFMFTCCSCCFNPSLGQG